MKLSKGKGGFQYAVLLPLCSFLTTAVHSFSVKESGSEFSVGLLERHRILDRFEVYS